MSSRLGRLRRTTSPDVAQPDPDVAQDPDTVTTGQIPVVTDQAPLAEDVAVPPRRRRRPLYHRLLRLRNIAPTPWQRAAFADLPFAIAVLLVLADLASAWTLLALPVAVAVIVKSHDLLAGLLTPRPARPQTQDGAAPEGTAPADERER